MSKQSARSKSLMSANEQLKSLEEALEWVRFEIRPLFEAEDFGKELTPELRAQEDRLRAQISRQQQA